MSKGFTRSALGEGIWISRITDKRFKTNRVSVNFILPLAAGTAARNAILPPLLHKACQDYPDFRRLNQRLGELYGAFLDTEVRKVGSLQVLNFSIRTIDNRYALAGEDLLFDCAKLLCDLIMRPLLVDGKFVEENFAVEKQVLMDDIRSKINDKRGYAISRCEEILFAGSALAVDELGDLESAQALTNEDAVQAYREMLRTARVEVMVTGADFSQAAADYVKDSFAALERIPFSGAQKLAAPVAAEDTVERMDVKQSKMVLGFSAPMVGEGELSAFRMMTAMYGGTPVSKLFLNVREKLSLCYYCVSRFDRLKGILMVDCGVENQNIEKAREEILRQLADMQKGAFTADEISAAQLSLRNSFTSLTDSLGGIENWYLTQICCGTEFSPEEEAEKIAAVTPEQIQAAAGKLELKAVYVLTGKEEGERE